MLYVPKISTLRLRQASLAALLPLLTLTTQAQSSVTNGLVAYWNFDAKNYKDSVGTFDGTENGANPIAFVDGKTGFGQAIQLDGADQFVEITGRDANYDPDQLAFEGGSVTIAGWFTVGTFDKSWQALIAKGEGSNWRVARNSANPSMSYAGGLTDAVGTTDVTDGNWHHFAAISDAAGAVFGTGIYIDGQLDGTIDGQAALAVNGSNVRIGDNPGATGRNWNGKVDDLAIWNRVLSADEITALYAGGTGKPVSAFFTPVVDTDKDGMPDEWEVKYGLNPNDPTDAAKDCNNNGVTNLDEFKAGLDPCDSTPPSVVSASATGTFDTIKLTFSEILDPAGATNAANYAISPTLAVTNAVYKNKVVTLSTAKQAPATAYTVTITGLKDLSKNQIAAGTKTTVNSYVITTNGVLKFSYYGDATGGESIPGTSIDGLLSDGRYPASPDIVLPVYSLNSRDAFPDDTHENYGATMDGFLTPKESASYNFFLRSDDAGQLWLSTDETEAKLALIAEETGCCQAFLEPDPNQGAAWHDNGSGIGQTTLTPIPLVSGKKYFIRAIYKEGGGGDYGQVAWRKSTDTNAASRLTPISAEFLSSTLALPAPPSGSTGTGPTVSIARSGNSLTIQWAPTGGTLESSPALGSTAAWTAVGTANPATVTIGAANAFYRIRN